MGQGGKNGSNGGENGGNKNGNGEKQNEDNGLIILKTHIHCQGCADNIIRSLKGFPGVEDVTVVAKDHKVMVKGKEADPLKVLERVRAKCTNKHVELISPKPKPKEPAKKPADDTEPLVMIIVIKIFMHCENCAQETRSCILGMKGVQMVTADTKNKQITVVGTIELEDLVDYLYKRVGKHATIVEHEYQDKEKAKRRMAKLTGKVDKTQQGEGSCSEKKKEEKLKDVYYHYPPQHYPDPMYPCLFLNDENPHACRIM